MALRKKAIIAAIMNDAEIRYNYINLEGQTCVIGGLARVAGVPDSVLRQAASGNISYGKNDVNNPYNSDAPNVYKAIKTIRRAITRRFGLTIREQYVLQKVNDRFKDDQRTARQAELVDTTENVEALRAFDKRLRTPLV